MIKLDHVTKSYLLDDDITFTALDDVSLTIGQGEFTSIIGPSGSGKSTLMHIVGLLDKPTSGSIYVQNKDISKLHDNDLSSLRNQFVGFVFQQFNLINKLTVLENILIPTLYARTELTYDPVEKARYLLKRFGLESKERSFPNKISGGQQQRIAIARALIMNPSLILADEPTGNLDSKSGTEILKLLQELHENEKMTVVIVTHDPSVAAKTKRQIVIRDGKVQ